MIWLIGNKGMLGTDAESVFQDKGFDFISSDVDVDITRLDCLRNFLNGRLVDWIVNCSAYTAVDRAEKETDKAFAVNVQGVENITIIAREKNVRLIHVSTDYVFDGTKQGDYSEKDTTNPQGIYGTSKLEGEQRVQKLWNHHFILRTAWLYGRHGNNFVHTMLRLFRERDEVRVVDDQWGSPTWSMDLTKIICKIIEADSRDFGIYHFSNEGRITWYQFAVKIYEISRQIGLIQRDVKIVPITSAEFPSAAKRPANSCLSKKKIEKTFHLTAPFWADSLHTFLELSKLKG